MSSLAENVGKIISAHPHGSKIKYAPRAVNQIKYGTLCNIMYFYTVEKLIIVELMNKLSHNQELETQRELEKHLPNIFKFQSIPAHSVSGQRH